jgi:hypothetical protein
VFYWRLIEIDENNKEQEETMSYRKAMTIAVLIAILISNLIQRFLVYLDIGYPTTIAVLLALSIAYFMESFINKKYKKSNNKNLG